MARDARDFVIGFIAQHRMEGVGLGEGEQQDNTEDFLILSPGVGLDTTGDGRQRDTGKQGGTLISNVCIIRMSSC